MPIANHPPMPTVAALMPGSGAGAEQYLTPSIAGLSPVYLNETAAGTSQYLTPGFAYVNEQGV